MQCFGPKPPLLVEWCNDTHFIYVCKLKCRTSHLTVEAAAVFFKGYMGKIILRLKGMGTLELKIQTVCQ